MIGSLATQSSCAMCSRRLVAQLATRLYPHKIMWLSTLKYVLLGQMQYTEFLAEIGKAGLSVRGFAELVGMNPNSISNYARTGELPTHLGLIAVLIGGVDDLGGDYRQVMSKVPLAPKKVRGSAQKGRFGGNRQATLELDS